MKHDYVIVGAGSADVVRANTNATVIMIAERVAHSVSDGK